MPAANSGLLSTHAITGFVAVGAAVKLPTELDTAAPTLVEIGIGAEEPVPVDTVAVAAPAGAGNCATS
jgi:hypothetical protein